MPLALAKTLDSKLLLETSKRDTVFDEEIQEDHEEEIESMESGFQVDDLSIEVERIALPNKEKGSKSMAIQPILAESLKAASEQILVESTRDEYGRLWKQFVAFAAQVGYISSADEFEKSLKIGSVPENIPTWVAVWIMDKCDEIDVRTNKPKPLKMPRMTYNHAQKMRAAISHKFGRELARGVQPWAEDPVLRTFKGNPSLSLEVSQYMIALRRRKVRSGEVVTSARAINEDMLKALYEFNLSIPDVEFGPNPRKRKAEHPESWGGSSVRTMLGVAYILSFLCLLRYDETLTLRWHWMMLETIDSQRRLKVSLPCRKTHQLGGIAPFYLYENKEKPWLCPILALSKWVQYNKENLEGYVFRKKVSATKFSSNPEQRMSTDSFLECFRNNLLDVSINPRPYGTHSFRRGGCQYLAMVVRWPIRDICTWGGWAENFDNPGTIFKYLLSWTDGTSVERQDYFNPSRRGGNPCSTCGRTCWCA